MKIIDRYIFRQLTIATVFTTLTLAAIILLTQSLRFLELVIESGASSTAFWMLSFLALPRFLEVIAPIALMIATLFIYNKMITDSELVILRATGAPPLATARPALTMAIIVTLLLWAVTAWLAPVSLSGMQQLRQVIKTQYSSILFREGVFNRIQPGLTVFVRDRAHNGELHGLMIHDSREKEKAPVTVLAKKGQLVITHENQKVIVYDGSRQSLDPQSGAIEKLQFERYTIDLPENTGPVKSRWREPDERTLPELLNPDFSDSRDIKWHRELTVEIHRRLAAPLLAPAYTLIALCFLILGPLNRRGQSGRLTAAAAIILVVQALYLLALNMARESNMGIVLMYALTVTPITISLLLLGEKIKLSRTFLMTWGKART